MNVLRCLQVHAFHRQVCVIDDQQNPGSQQIREIPTLSVIDGNGFQSKLNPIFSRHEQNGLIFIRMENRIPLDQFCLSDAAHSLEDNPVPLLHEMVDGVKFLRSSCKPGYRGRAI